MEVSQNALGKFLDPQSIIGQIEIEQGSLVADFGCGPGYFSLPFAKTVGRDGKVYALDILPQALETVESKRKNEGITNIETKRVNLEKEGGSKLEEESVDWVVMKDVLFQNTHKDVMIKESYKILKQGGRVLVVEWNQIDCGIGPDKELRISKENLKNLFTEQGFRIEKDIAAGDFHYSFVAIK